MSKRIPLLLLFNVVFLFPLSTFAWGDKGHHLIAQIASYYLDDTTRSKVQAYLGTMTFEEAATWMDSVRSRPEYDYMKPWHYINIPERAQYTPSQEANIVTALLKVIDELKHKEALSATDIKTNLCILFHLIGDLHQPLHVGYDSDRGGNNIAVSFLGNGTNLHRVWDSEIIQEQNISLTDCLSRSKNYSAKQIDSLKTAHIVTWMEESRTHLSDVYNFSNALITKAYISRNAQLIAQQLFLSGIRLANVLQEIFSK